MADVLVLCRANLCRSPAVEVMLRAALPAASSLTVASRGLRPVPGLQVPEEVTSWLAGRGLDVTGHEPTAVRKQDVDDAVLVVVMTRSQRSALVSAHPAALRRTVLLGEAADRVAVRSDGSFAVGPATAAGSPDLTDPYGKPADEVAAILGEAEEHVRRLADALAPVQP